MQLPDFSPEEQFLVNHVKGTISSRGSDSFMLGYLIGSSIVAGFAAYYGSNPMLLCAFGMVCAFRLYEQSVFDRWTPIWRSIIEKYETAALERAEP